MRTEREMAYIEENRRNEWQGYLMFAGMFIVPVICGSLVPSSEGGFTVALAAIAGFIAWGAVWHILVDGPNEARREALFLADCREGKYDWSSGGLSTYGKFHLGGLGCR